MSFGFDADRLLVWIGVRQPLEDPMQSGSLCRRHADAMVVPQGWTLDDRREPEPKLFRDPTARPKALPGSTAPSAKSRRRRTTKAAAVAAAAAPVATAEQPALDVDVRTVANVAGPMSDPDSTAQLPWWPAFDEADDLDGVLAADTPLLARAFRGADRPR